jgi:hypothetical protein
MPLPRMPIRRDPEPRDEDHGSDYDSRAGWWQRTPTPAPQPKKQ